MPVALSRNRGQRYNYPINGIALWRPIAIITGMDAKDRKIERLERLVAKQAVANGTSDFRGALGSALELLILGASWSDLNLKMGTLCDDFVDRS